MTTSNHPRSITSLGKVVSPYVVLSLVLNSIIADHFTVCGQMTQFEDFFGTHLTSSSIGLNTIHSRQFLTTSALRWPEPTSVSMCLFVPLSEFANHFFSIYLMFTVNLWWTVPILIDDRYTTRHVDHDTQIHNIENLPHVSVQQLLCVFKRQTWMRLWR